MLETLLGISKSERALVTHGGVYDPTLNVWIADSLPKVVAESSTEMRRFLDAMAGIALAAGNVHLRQLADAKMGRVWPLEWLNAEGGADVIDFCTSHPEAASPYACVDRAEQRAIPYSHRYRSELEAVHDAIGKALLVGGKEIEVLAPYLTKLQDAFRNEDGRVSDIDAMGEADIGWLEIADDAHYLLIAEFTETYADPLKHHIGNDPAVNAWAKQVAEQTGLGPWKTFFEFRLLELLESHVTTHEIGAIRTTIRRLYEEVSDTAPSAKARTEFRHALINAGHGANPPKSAKNYPNQNWIRQEYGYRNVIFANQAQEKVRGELVPALQTAFDKTWSRDPLLVDRMLRANALFIVAHEESHPWVVFNEVSWLEELKCNVLGMWALHKASEIKDDITEVMLHAVAGALNAQLQQPKLMARAEMQLQDYYIGDVIFTTFLADGGYFVYDSAGIVVDVRGELAAPLIEKFVERILAIKRGDSSPADLYNELYRDALVFERFRGFDT